MMAKSSTTNYLPESTTYKSSYNYNTFSDNKTNKNYNNINDNKNNNNKNNLN